MSERVSSEWLKHPDDIEPPPQLSEFGLADWVCRVMNTLGSQLLQDPCSWHVTRVNKESALKSYGEFHRGLPAQVKRYHHLQKLG